MAHHIDPLFMAHELELSFNQQSSIHCLWSINSKLVLLNCPLPRCADIVVIIRFSDQYFEHATDKGSKYIFILLYPFKPFKVFDIF